MTHARLSNGVSLACEVHGDPDDPKADQADGGSSTSRSCTSAMRARFCARPDARSWRHDTGFTYWLTGAYYHRHRTIRIVSAKWNSDPSVRSRLRPSTEMNC